MPRSKPILNPNQKNLIRRYLIWCYKTTKEDLDRIDRYATQFVVDQYMLEKLKFLKPSAGIASEYKKLVEGFNDYLLNKKNKADEKKYVDSRKKEMAGSYVYLQERLKAIEEAVVFFLGKKDLTAIIKMYEQEMTSRILTAREHT